MIKNTFTALIGVGICLSGLAQEKQAEHTPEVYHQRYLTNMTLSATCLATGATIFVSPYMEGNLGGHEWRQRTTRWSIGLGVAALVTGGLAFYNHRKGPKRVEVGTSSNGAALRFKF